MGVLESSKFNPVERDSTLRIFLSWLTFLTVIPLLTIVFFPLAIWKLLVRTYAKLFIKSVGDTLTGYDSIFAIDRYYEKPYAGNVTLFVVDGQMSLVSLRTNFITHVLSVKTKSEGGEEPQFDKLFKVPVTIGGYFFWKAVDVQIEAQIRIAHSFSSADRHSHEDELNQVMGKLMTQPFPEGCPLWELLLFTGYKNTQSVIVFRLHHTLGDGYTFNHLVDQMIQKKSKYMVQSPKPGKDKKPSLLLTAAPKLCKLYSEGFTHKDYYTQSKANTTGLVSMTTIDLETMKQIRRATGSHFATVGMSILCGALRRYFLETRSAKELPPYVSIMHSLPKPNHPINRMVNHWGVGIFKIPMDVHSALDRLKLAEMNFESYMNDQYNELFQCQVPFFNLLPASLIRLFFKTNFGTSMGFTSVPAYDKEASLFGEWRIRNMSKFFGFQWGQTAVAAAVYTHNGQVSFTINVNKDIVPDQEGIDRVTKNYLQDEISELIHQCDLDVALSKVKIPMPILRNLEGFA